MRNNSETFELYNQSPQRALRLVVVIEFPVPVYLASHGDISGLPAGALGGVLGKVSSTSQRLIPEQGRAEIGAINFELVDVGGVFTDTLRDQLAAGYGIKGRTVRLYQGGAGMDWADFRLEQTQVAEESLSYDHGCYRVRCRDVQRYMRQDIFTPRSTRLAADFAKGASTLQVYSTADFEPCPHTASFGDAPGQTVYYLKIKYQNGWEVVRATGKTGTTFTGVTRGLFGTVEYGHTVPAENDSDKGIEVEEFIYLELPASALAYALLTGKILGTANSLPSNWHLGIDPALVVADEFENVGSDWYKPGDYAKGVILRFDGLTKTDGKKFIEQEINLLMGAYMPVNAAGQLGFRRMTGVLADAGTVTDITADHVVSLGELQQDLAALRNIFSIQWAWYEAPGFDGRFLRSNVLADAASIAAHGESKPQALKFKGLHNSRHTFTTLKNRFDALRDRFAGPPLRLRLSLLPSKNDIEVGDVVRVTLPQVRDYTAADTLDRAMEVQRISVDQTSGAVQVELFGSTQAAAAANDEAASVSAELPDGWYSTAGTEMTAAGLSIDGSGFLTADGNLTGSASSRTIFYYLGDLTIPAGYTLTVTQNVELRVMGVLQVDGTLRGAPSNSGSGFLGSCRGGSGRALGKYGYSAPWVDFNGEVVRGRNEVMPMLAIDNDGGDLAGIPDDLRGSGGARGGNSYNYLQGDRSYEPGGLGGVGGAGGAGLVVVARGVALGAAGKIDTSGGDGLPGGVDAFAPGGSGGGGAPGGVLLIIDGHQNPQPVLTSSKLVACYGDSPSNPGNPGLGGHCLGAAAARVYTVPKSRSPYPNYTQDPEIDPAVQQAIADATAAQQAAAAAQANADSALDKLDEIGADGKLHPSEKLRVKLEYSRLLSEQAGIEASANAFGLTSEKTAYTSALNALTSYLGGLSPTWDSTASTTAISRTLWNSNWQAVYDARQTLLNKVAAEAGERATWTKLGDRPGDGELLNTLQEYGAILNRPPRSQAVQANVKNWEKISQPADFPLVDVAFQLWVDRASKTLSWRHIGFTSQTRVMWVRFELEVIGAAVTAHTIVSANNTATGSAAAPIAFDGDSACEWGSNGLKWSETVGDSANDRTDITLSKLDASVGFRLKIYQLESNRAADVNGVIFGDTLIQSGWVELGVDDPVQLYFSVDDQSDYDVLQMKNAPAEAGATVGATGDQLQQLADAEAAAADAQADSSAALAELDEIGADGKLHPAEKKLAIQEYNRLQGEQAGIVATANAYGLTAARNTYQSALTTLTSYLGGVGPYDWDDMAGTTVVTRTLWRSNWQAVYDARQALLDAVAAEAGLRADWSQVGGSGKPADNADVTADQLAGNGINLLKPRYAGIGSKSAPYYVYAVNRGNLVVDTTTKFSGDASLRMEATDTDFYAYLGTSTSDYNIKASGWGRSYIVSAYVRCNLASKSGQLMLVDPAGNHHGVTFTTHATAFTWARVSGVITLPNSGSFALMRVDNDGGAGCNMWFDQLMVEVQVGTGTAPSQYAAPGGVGTSDFDDDAGLGESATWDQIGGSGKPEDFANYGARTDLSNVSGAGNMVIDARASARITAERPDGSYKNSELSANDVQQSFVLQYIGGRGANLNHPSYTRFLGYTLPPFYFSPRVTTSMHTTATSPIGATCLRVTCADVAAFGYLDFRNKDDALFNLESGKTYIISYWATGSITGINFRVYAIGAGNTPATIPAGGWSVTVGGWQRFSTALTATASGGAFLRLAVNKDTWNIGSQLYLDGLMIEEAVGDVTTPSALQETGSSYIDPYTGRPFDQRGLPMLNSDLSSVALSAVCTAVDAGTTATINIAAHTVQFGNFSVNYGSASITGLGFSTKYYVYCDDPGYAGGAVSYFATTNWATAQAGVHRRLVDYVTTPADGGSSSGGGTLPPDECVASGMWLRDGLRVDDAMDGDAIDVWDTGDTDAHRGAIEAIRPAVEVPCVRLITASGAQVECSVSTPVTGPDGGVRKAPAALGMLLGVLHGDAPLVWERVTEVVPIGPRTVYRLSCGNISFAAGVDPAHRVVTHNIRYKP
ncbi:hypothetical protein [Microbulbifer sp. ALW1]|uniref:hypothetical protein n=1 Tax=Microbulbifer sp. (strain ALW1) TaxID=1516059 RepID=UPI00135B1B73|nr:hypothetical protein [Microbulbifer sp. ALW1]